MYPQPMARKSMCSCAVRIIWLMVVLVSVLDAYPCFGDTGAFIINVKVYVDEDSAREIGKYSRRLQKHSDMYQFNDEDGGLTNVKFFFGLIFDQINATILDSNIQLEADYSEMLEPKYQNLKEKYCVHFSNIINITETFLAEEILPERMGENKLLVIDCSGNSPYLPQRTHIATKNGCGHVAGVLFADVHNLHTVVRELLYNVFAKKTWANAIEADRKLSFCKCTLISQCAARYHDFGFFKKGLRSIGKPADLVAIQYFGDDVWDFGHSPSLEVSSKYGSYNNKN